MYQALRQQKDSNISSSCCGKICEETYYKSKLWFVTEIWTQCCDRTEKGAGNYVWAIREDFVEQMRFDPGLGK